jgi:hypothetical protein
LYGAFGRADVVFGRCSGSIPERDPELFVPANGLFVPSKRSGGADPRRGMAYWPGSSCRGRPARRGAWRLARLLSCEAVVADADELREVALSLEGVEENESDGFDFRVGGRGFVWSYPERVPGRRRVIRTDIAVLFVGDEAEKQALLLGEPELFFTVPSYDGVPLVMVRLDRVGAERLEELVTDAWRMRGSPV